MIRTMVASSVLVTAFLLSAAPAKADWLCGADRCVWVEYDVVEPVYALTWAPPARPSCFWKQGIFGRWKLICP